MKNILIVDDEFLIRYSLSQVLQSASVLVTAVSSGSEALQLITTTEFDLCCLDIHLPDINGLDLMKKIRRQRPEAKIIIMTGGEVTDTMLADIRENSELLLSKPFDLFKVKSFVDRLLTAGSRAAFSWTDADRAGNGEYGIQTDQRRHRRYPAERDPATLFDDQRGGRSAEIIDRSDGGLCVTTTYYLEQGLILKICNDKTGDCTGTVRWSIRTGDADLFRTGIEFTPEAG